MGQHAAWALSWPADSLMRRILADVVDNSTVLFVFLSGFLFAHLAGRYTYPQFLRRRFSTVVLPYLCVVLPAAVLAVLSPRVGGPFTDVAGQPALVRFGWFLLHGSTMANLALWFIPMIALYYLASPLFSLFLRMPRLYWLLLLLLVPFALLAHRPALIPHVDLPALAAYYTPVYVLGMCVSHHRARIESLARFWWVLAIGYGAGLIAQIVFGTHHGNYEGAALFTQEHGLVDWTLAQKLVLCVALLAVAQRFAHRLGGLRHLGFASFSIYLVHCYFVNAIKLGMDALHLEGSVLTWAVTTALALGASLVLVDGVRWLLGPRSIYVIGSVDERRLRLPRPRPATP